jgi:hypothetical protein
MSERTSIPDWTPMNRVILTTVGRHNVGLRIFSHKESGRYFQAVFSHEQLAQIAHLADQARRGAYAEEFITGADETLLQFHGIAARADAPLLSAIHPTNPTNPESL